MGGTCGKGIDGCKEKKLDSWQWCTKKKAGLPAKSKRKNSWGAIVDLKFIKGQKRGKQEINK